MLGVRLRENVRIGAILAGKEEQIFVLLGDKGCGQG
ncbi:uncharacterized protein METZ01_LOCUS508362 [marine metagenome]|uniref:Uncharacterized protein n=1 Tax=marine metagenome TaxID=408172 RepID=A0A383EHD4_9ZZZZ